MNKKGIIESVLIAPYVIFAIIATSFIITVANGTASNQLQKIKDAHNAPITVDKDITGNGGNL